MVIDMMEKVRSGEAVAFSAGGVPLMRAPAVPSTAIILPCFFGAGMDFVQVWPIPDTDGEQKCDAVLRGCVTDVMGMGYSEDWQELMKRLDGSDEKWHLTRVGILSKTSALLCFGSVEAPGTMGTMLWDFAGKSGATFEIRQSMSREQSPYRKIVYKLKENELVLAYWMAWVETRVYRINLKDDTQTVEVYPHDASVIIKNL